MSNADSDLLSADERADVEEWRRSKRRTTGERMMLAIIDRLAPKPREEAQR